MGAGTQEAFAKWRRYSGFQGNRSMKAVSLAGFILSFFFGGGMFSKLWSLLGGVWR